MLFTTKQYVVVVSNFNGIEENSALVRIRKIQDKASEVTAV